MSRFGVVILFVAVAWVLQLALALWQTHAFYRRYALLRRGAAASAIGVSGSNWRRKTYGVLIVDESRTIVRAERLAGISIFARLREVPQIVGLPLQRVERDDPVEGVPGKTWDAFRNAAGYIVSHDSNLKEVQEA